MEIDQISGIFVECFQNSAVFERAAGGTVIETEIVKKDNKKWVVIAAGIHPSLAETYFPASPGRAERSTEPVTIVPSGRLSVLFVLRPISIALEEIAHLENIAAFAPGKGIPFVQIRQ